MEFLLHSAIYELRIVKYSQNPPPNNLIEANAVAVALFYSHQLKDKNFEF